MPLSSQTESFSDGVNPAIARASVYISFEPSKRFVENVVRWLTDFCRLSLEDLDLVSRLHLAVHELVENIVKYSASKGVGIEVELERGPEKSFLRVRTRNKATEAQLERATRILKGLKEADDPVAYYDRLVRNTAPKEGESGLGLARIKVEGELDIDYEVHGDELCIVVETELARPVEQ